MQRIRHRISEVGTREEDAHDVCRWQPGHDGSSTVAIHSDMIAQERCGNVFDACQCCAATEDILRASGAAHVSSYELQLSAPTLFAIAIDPSSCEHRSAVRVDAEDRSAHALLSSQKIAHLNKGTMNFANNVMRADALLRHENSGAQHANTYADTKDAVIDALIGKRDFKEVKNRHGNRVRRRYTVHVHPQNSMSRYLEKLSDDIHTTNRDVSVKRKSNEKNWWNVTIKEDAIKKAKKQSASKNGANTMLVNNEWWPTISGEYGAVFETIMKDKANPRVQVLRNKDEKELRQKFMVSVMPQIVAKVADKLKFVIADVKR